MYPKHNSSYIARLEITSNFMHENMLKSHFNSSLWNLDRFCKLQVHHFCWNFHRVGNGALQFRARIEAVAKFVRDDEGRCSSQRHWCIGGQKTEEFRSWGLTYNKRYYNHSMLVNRIWGMVLLLTKLNFTQFFCGFEA